MKIVRELPYWLPHNHGLTADINMFDELKMYSDILRNTENFDAYSIYYNTRHYYRDIDRYTGQRTTLRRNKITLKIIDKNKSLLIVSCGYNVSRPDIQYYFRYGGASYYYQTPRSTGWGHTTPEMFIQIEDDFNKLINNISRNIMDGTSLKIKKKDISMIEQWLGTTKLTEAINNKSK